VVHDAAQAAGDSVEELPLIEGGNDGVVDFEQQAQTIAVARELLLVDLGPFEIERVVHGQGHLAGNLLHEIDFGRGRSGKAQPCRRPGSEAVLGGGERHQAKGADLLAPQHFHDAGEGSLGGDVVDDDGLLGFKDAAGGSVLHGRFGAGPDAGGLLGFEDVDAHDLAPGIVQDEIQIIEMGDAVQSSGQVVEEFGQAAVVSDGFGDFEQGLLARSSRFFGRSLCGELSHAGSIHRGETALKQGARPAKKVLVKDANF
jgi:hypothetical protein